MDNSKFLRDVMVQSLKEEKGLQGVAIKNIDGNYACAADIYLFNSNGEKDTYRIIIAKVKDD